MRKKLTFYVVIGAIGGIVGVMTNPYWEWVRQFWKRGAEVRKERGE